MASYLFQTATITLILLILSPARSDASLILDGDGDPLRNGGDYYIIPQSSAKGGLTLTQEKGSSSPCPLFITQDSSSSGSPVRISSLFRIMILKTSFPIIFSFDKVFTTCNKPLRWWVAPSDANNKAHVIVGTNGPFKPTYSFHIEEAKNGNKNVYNIKFCHTIESDIFKVTATECKDVAILDDGLLGVTENGPFPVTFEKYSPRIASYV